MPSRRTRTASPSVVKLPEAKHRFVLLSRR
jgi:hypothetical protein